MVRSSEVWYNMTLIQAEGLDHRAINEAIRSGGEQCVIQGCCGQRFLGAGMSARQMEICGTPGNALGAYLNGGSITVRGNAQDAVGDTMNDGTIVVHGSIGDAAGYAMRGGRLFVRGDAGYRAGTHLKEYHEKVPVLIIGGRAGSFLGEYQAGGIIAVLNLHEPSRRMVGNFPCTGMHGGRVFLRSDCRDIVFPAQVTATAATEEDMAALLPSLGDWCRVFGVSLEEVLSQPFTVVTPDSHNPYRQMYVPN